MSIAWSGPRFTRYQRAASTPISSISSSSEHDVAAPLGHLRLRAALRQMHGLVEQHLEALRVVAEHRRSRLQPCDIAVVVGAEDVDQRARSRARTCRARTRRRRRSRGSCRRTSGSAAGPCRRRARSSAPTPSPPPRTSRCCRDRLGRIRLDHALKSPDVEMDPETLERGLDPPHHVRHRIAFELRELLDVGAAVAVLGRLLAPAHGVDRRTEAVHLAAGCRCSSTRARPRGPRTRAVAQQRRRTRRFAPQTRGSALSGWRTPSRRSRAPASPPSASRSPPRSRRAPRRGSRRSRRGSGTPARRPRLDRRPGDLEPPAASSSASSRGDLRRVAARRSATFVA